MIEVNYHVTRMTCCPIGLCYDRAEISRYHTSHIGLFCLPNLSIWLKLTTMSPELLIGGLKFYWYHAYHIGSFCLPNLLIQSSYTLFNIIHFTIPSRTYLCLSCFVLGTACYISLWSMKLSMIATCFCAASIREKKHNLFCQFAALISHSPRQSIFHSMEEQNTMTIIIM